jgi:peptide deformylase
MILDVVKEPNEILHKKAAPITEITDELEQLANDMYETMVESDGVGIAAPQVGKSIRLAVVQVDEDDDTFVMINPKIIEREGENIDIEGCLSIPHVFGTVKRADKIVVRYVDLDGMEIELEAYDFLARAIQHEIDHLDGILFTEKMIDEISEDELEDYYARLEEDESEDFE